MNQTVAKTQEMLAKHHRDGEAFAQLMKETFSNRFNEDFWAYWRDKLAPALPSAGVVLDLGTGPGMFLHAVLQRHPGVHVYGVECADYMLNAVEKLPPNAQIISADLHDPHLPLADNSVDIAVASVVLHEMHQPVKTLLELQRCLKPGALVYILDWVRAPLHVYLQNTDLDVFAAQTPAEQLEDLFVHFIEHNRFSSADLEFLLQQCGYTVLENTPLVNGRQARILAQKK